MFVFISEKKKLDEETARMIFQQVVEAVLIFKAKGILHGDIKDQNILINAETLLIKFIDFGCSLPYYEGEYYDFDIMTRVYAPPEFIRYEKYTANGLNVWSLGILLYNLVCGDIPFDNDDEILEPVLTFPDHLSLHCCYLIRSCLQMKSEKRIKLEDVLSNPWITKK